MSQSGIAQNVIKKCRKRRKKNGFQEKRNLMTRKIYPIKTKRTKNLDC